MISCYEFQKMDGVIQEHILYQDGIYLMRRSTPRLEVFLYALYKFHVEIFIDFDGQVLYVKAFEDQNIMEVYLEMICINNLLGPINDTGQ
ncbi:MAG: hypothetical protein ACXWV0_05510 [Flavisolibacter sp.]